MSSSESEYDPREALDEIDRDMDALEATLRPLLDHREEHRSWRETLDTLGNMEQAKMNMIMAYGICDLVWIFLRLKGLDPTDHPVMKELDRIKTYYLKVRDAENPPKRANKVDLAAAGRFITASIPRAQRLPAAAPGAAAGEETASAAESSSRASTPAPQVEDYQVGKSSRFKIAHDALPEKLQRTDTQQDQMRVVNDDDDGDGDGDGTPVVPAAAAAETGETKTAAVSKHRRGKRVAAEDFLDEETPKKTKSAAVAAAATATAGGGKVRKQRKSTGKRS